jgi:hypothetical protein
MRKPEIRNLKVESVVRQKGKRCDAKARKVGDRVPQLPKAFCGNKRVLEGSGLK